MRDDAVLGRALPLDRGLGPPTGSTAYVRLSTYRLNGLCKGDAHPAYTPLEYGPPLALLSEARQYPE